MPKVQFVCQCWDLEGGESCRASNNKIIEAEEANSLLSTHRLCRSYVTPVEKQPWEMTKDEWFAEWGKTEINFAGCGGGGAGPGLHGSSKVASTFICERQAFLKMDLDDARPDPDDPWFQVPPRHFQVIEEALRQRKPVPARVLDEYPEFAGKGKRRTDG
ncbi:MAG: hypothetical protein ABIH23_19505 [bacterium]